MKWTLKFQTFLKGTGILLVQPTVFLWRLILKKSMSFELNGRHTNKVLTVWMPQFIACDIDLTGDYKKFFDGMYWDGPDAFSRKNIPITYKNSFIIHEYLMIGRVVAMIFGNMSATRCIRLYFKEIPQKGSCTIKTC